jgi:restriction system protein
LTEDEKNRTYPNNIKGIFYDRINWAKSYMKQAGLVEYPKKAVFKITERGIDLLNENPSKIDSHLLRRYPEFIDFLKRNTPKSHEDDTVENDLESSHKTPFETLEESHQSLKDELIEDLLIQIKELSPAFFEKLVVDLLVKMGYGGSIQDAGQAIGKTSDHGIDGIIKEDRLGLDIIYVQAKKWDSSQVGRPEIQKFVGALQEQRARKGIFITTSTFSEQARDYVTRIENKVILIDGKTLAEFMFETDLGLNTMGVYKVKRIDTDYFTE